AETARRRRCGWDCDRKRDTGNVTRDAYIQVALRTPVGKHGGSLGGVRPDDLAAIPIKAVVERSGIDSASIDDVILGCANQAGEDNRNVARMALLLAGLPVPVRAADGTVFAEDEYPRAGTTLDSVAKLKPAFRKDGTVTAASSSGINDGAAALLVTAAKGGEGRRGAAMARIVTTAVAGVDPSCMGLGPIPATKKALKRAGLTIDQIGLVELNE